MKNIPKEFEMRTKRLILRSWKQSDLDPLAKMNADQKVMEYYPSVKTFQESLEEYHRFLDQFNKNGWGFWAVSVIAGPEFIGFIGLNQVSFISHFTPAVEVGWRLDFEYWRQGYATEGAIASLRYGFETLDLNEIVSFTVPENFRSRTVMEKIGMHRDPKDDFDHPRLPDGHKLRRHVLYRISRNEFFEKYPKLQS